MPTHKAKKQGYRFCRYLYYCWSLVVITSLTWNLYLLHNQIIEQARIEARTIFAHNLAYRKWNTRHGGLYVKVDEVSTPNPYLKTDDRDLVTADGTMLTMINPFQMTREAYELLQQETPLPVYNRTVSREFLNPANEPDSWEDAGLETFHTGSEEVSEMTLMEGKPYMRLMRPYITSGGCIKCHGFQGYDVGDIRGGMSISVPMEPYMAQEDFSRRTIVLTHGILWLLGLAAIGLLNRNIVRNQQQLKESEKKFRVLAESASDWEYWLSESEGIVFMSPSCREVTGYSREEFQKDPELVARIIDQEDREKYLAYRAEKSVEHLAPLEIKIKTKDGSVKCLSHIWRTIYIDGVIMGRRITNRDITSRKQLESQLYQAQKMEAIGSLTGGIAHDFNNILTAILGYSLLSLRQLPDESPVRKNMEAIYQAGEKAAAMTRQLLAFSRKQVLKLQPIDLSAAVTEMENMIDRLLGEDIALTVQLGASDMVVMADRSQLDQILLNLCVNARDAMSEGGCLSIDVDNTYFDSSILKEYRGLRSGHYFRLRVKDTGSGISPEIQDKIFEPFYTTKEIGKGTGLGLATVYGIVKQHNGFIYVDSAPGRGTVFTVLLPAFRNSPPGDEKSEDEVMPGGTETILVVDDEEAICELVADTLKTLGYTVMIALCASQAIKQVMAADRKIDLVLTDVVMPGMNGRELAESLAGISPQTRIMYMSGHTNKILAPEGSLEAELHFIAKPFTPYALAKKIRETLDE